MSSFTIERLRVWLLVGAALLVLVIAGFLGYARYRAHRFLAGLPAKLGVNIRRETNGYTYSQSIKGRTVMTLHAAKAVERLDGNLTLHDVSMILYGRTQDRTDHIAGSQFEYDQKAGVVRAVGEVQIDLQGPSQPVSHDAVSEKATKANGERKIVHVKTSGLVYIQKLGVAATDKDLEFTFGGMTGHAKGADYNSNTGTLVLQSDITVHGLQQNKPVTLTASHAELERASQRVLLTQASYRSQDESAGGDHAVVSLRDDGSPERIEAEGNVTLKSLTQGTVTAPRADVLLSESGQAQKVHLVGGVRSENKKPLLEEAGQAEEVWVNFDGTGDPAKVDLLGTARIQERSRQSQQALWNIRNAVADKMSFAFKKETARAKEILREAQASGSARVTLVTAVGSSSSTTNEIAGESLHGYFADSGVSTRLSALHGAGRTSFRRIASSGAEQTSVGDTLDITLLPVTAIGTRAEGIRTAVQSGHVVLTRQGASKAGAFPSLLRSTANLAVYDGATDQLTLTEQAQIFEENGTVFADKIVMKHASGDATANGNVKATYQQIQTAEPVHVLSDHADFERISDQAIFYGARGRPVRLWQGASQVEAPVIAMDHQQRSLNAYGNTGDEVGTPVHAVLVQRNGMERGESSHSPVIRIASRKMVYRDPDHEVQFAGDVRAESSEGVLHAQQAIVYLHAPQDAAEASNESLRKYASTRIGLTGGVERIVATGKIEVQQTGRRATGERLVYTAASGIFVLTGTATESPHLTDQTQGTITGASLSFHAGDDRIAVVGAKDAAPQRVRTIIHLEKKQ